MSAIVKTYSGVMFNLVAPRTGDVNIFDIAHALSNTARFNGHTRDFYSVAQHSVLVSQAVPLEDRLAGLLHDAAEAYIGDIVSPLKHLEGLELIREVEYGILEAIGERFGVVLHPKPHSVAVADLRALRAEYRDLTLDGEALGDCTSYAPLLYVVEPLCPSDAEMEFLSAFGEYVGGV